MELYTKEELDKLKELIIEVNSIDNFKDTLESIDNCMKILEVSSKEE